MALSVDQIISQLLRGPVLVSPAEWEALDLYCGWTIKVRSIQMRMIQLGWVGDRLQITLVMNDPSVKTWTLG